MLWASNLAVANLATMAVLERGLSSMWLEQHVARHGSFLTCLWLLSAHVFNRSVLCYNCAVAESGTLLFIHNCWAGVCAVGRLLVLACWSPLEMPCRQVVGCLELHRCSLQGPPAECFPAPACM